MNDWSSEETDDPHYADRRNFYKVEKWSRDGLRVELMLCAGNNLDKARTIFASYIRIRPRARISIRQRTRVLERWPRHGRPRRRRVNNLPWELSQMSERSRARRDRRKIPRTGPNLVFR